MAFAAKLCNPTPWQAVLDYAPGIRLRVDGFDSVPLTMSQMDDFRGDKPGSEAVDAVLDTFGLFLFDSDRPYDNQALEALKRMLAILSDRYRSADQRLRASHSAQGISTNEEAHAETMAQLGYKTVGEKIEVLKTQIKEYEKIAGPTSRNVRPKLDPKRTIFVISPPREFPSVAAMEFFLRENAEIAMQHKTFVARQEAAAPVEHKVPATGDGTTVAPAQLPSEVSAEGLAQLARAARWSEEMESRPPVEHQPVPTGPHSEVSIGGGAFIANAQVDDDPDVQ